MTIHFRIGDIDAASELVSRHHYSKRMPSNIQLIGTWHNEGGLFGDYGPAVAACIFTIPGTRWSEEVWELARLVRNGPCPPLSGLIAACCTHIRRIDGIDLLVSFADATHDHHGGVYQSSSWRFDCQRGKNMDGILLNGTFVPGRSCNSRWGTRSPDKLRAMLPGRTVEPHYDMGKYLYWRALSRSGVAKAKRLGLHANPYPKPDEKSPTVCEIAY